MSFTKGGKGKKAPYSTIHYRIPEPIKPVVERLANGYKTLLGYGREPNELLKQVDSAITSTTYPDDTKLVPAKSDKQIALELLDEFLGESDIPLDEKGKPKARYDQLAKFKQWLSGT